MSLHIKSKRLRRLPDALRHQLRMARKGHGWSQSELGVRVGLPQTHISGIENGNIVPRYDTLLDLARVLDHDLLMVPRELVPVVQALIRDHRNPEAGGNAEDGERPLYATDAGEEERDEA